MKVKVRCIRDYFDLELGTIIRANPEDPNYERVITRERADKLLELNLIEELGVVKEEKKEQATKPTKKVEKAVK